MNAKVADIEWRTRAEARAIERHNIRTNPGPLNYEPWAGADIPPASSEAASLGRFPRGMLGKIGIVGLVAGVYFSIDEIVNAPPGGLGRAIGDVAGTWAGAWAGAEAGAAAGSLLGPVGTVVGGIVGGILGGIAGGLIGGGLGSWFD